MILPTNVSETEKIKGFRLSFPSLRPPFRGIAPEFDQARLLRVQFQSELPQPFPQVREKPFRFCPMLKPQHCVVRIPHHDDIAVRHLLPPRLHPEIENIMQV